MPSPRRPEPTTPPWPRRGFYRFAGREEPVLVVGWDNDEARIIDSHGRLRRVLEERVRVEPAA
jgi:hypothetical protein